MRPEGHMDRAKLFSGNKVLVSMIVFIAAELVVNGSWIGARAVSAAAHGAPIPDMLFSYAPSSLGGMFAALGEAGRAAYLAMNAFDFIFAAAYGVFYFLTLGWLATRLFPARPGLRFVSFFGLSGALCDEAENTIFRFAASGASIDGVPASLASVFSTAKLCLFCATMALVLVGLAAVVIKASASRLRRRKG
jgi:hypothetical protein